MRRFVCRGALAMAIAVTGLAIPSAAEAAPTNINVFFGVPPAATTDAGEHTEYTITFTANAGLNDNPGTAVILNAAGAGLAPGTIFPPSAPADEEGAFYTVGSGGSNGLVVAPVQLQNGGQTAIIPTFSTGVDAAPGTTVTVTIGYVNEEKVQNPAAPCSCKLALRTTVGTDATFNVSNTYEVVEGDGQLTVVSGDEQETKAGTAFATPLQAKLVDGLGDPVQGETITFTAPSAADVPSGTFAGGTDGGAVYEAVTGADGIATSSIITANGEVGGWQATASADEGSVGDVEDAHFDLENLPGDPDSVALEVTPEEITGDGVSTTRATATITDEFGNPLADRDVTFESTGDQEISDTVELAGGQYRATITSTTDVGTFTVTATDTDSGLFSFDTFEQLEDTVGPKVILINTPPKESGKKKARFTFEGNQADAESFECKLDSGNFKDCDSPKKYKVKKGKHKFEVRATDQNGNTGPAKSYEFKRT
jgi:hypothetical protein